MPHTHTFGDPLPIPMFLLNWTLPMISLALTTFAMGIDWHYIAGAAAGSLGGSLAFGFVRREGRFANQLYKTVIAWIGGLIVGGAAVHWWGIEAMQLVVFTYFFAALVFLIFLRTVVKLVEDNADGITNIVFQRIFKVPLARGPGDSRPRRSKRKGVQVNIPKGGGDPVVKIEKTAIPDEIRLVEETHIQQPKDPCP